ncbi:MAG: hypothetical protein AAF830_01995 [Pseudomonadota bacterium]
MIPLTVLLALGFLFGALYRPKPKRKTRIPWRFSKRLHLNDVPLLGTQEMVVAIREEPLMIRHSQCAEMTAGCFELPDGQYYDGPVALYETIPEGEGESFRSALDYLTIYRIRVRFDVPEIEGLVPRAEVLEVLGEASHPEFAERLPVWKAEDEAADALYRDLPPTE